MARTSYLARRDGRYFIQARFAARFAPLVGKPLYRASLGTSDYRLARLRLSECLGWFHRMNDSVDYTSLFQKNVAELRAYLIYAPPGREPKLTTRLQEWWTLPDFATFRAEVRKAFKADIPLAERSAWEDWITRDRAEIGHLTAEIGLAEAEIDRIVYELFERTGKEIAILESAI